MSESKREELARQVYNIMCLCVGFTKSKSEAIADLILEKEREAIRWAIEWDWGCAADDNKLESDIRDAIEEYELERADSASESREGGRE